jgi:hypothetical protein
MTSAGAVFLVLSNGLGLLLLLVGLGIIVEIAGGAGGAMGRRRHIGRVRATTRGEEEVRHLEELRKRRRGEDD